MNQQLVLTFFLLSGIFETETDNFVCSHGYKRGSLIPICGKVFEEKDLDGKTIFLREDAANAFLQMKQSALSDGVDLRINYAFRTNGQQKAVKRRNRKLAAKTGYSPHQQGIAVDIAGTVIYKKRKKLKTTISEWLEINAEKFGFIKTIKHEPWHYEFISTEGI